MKKKMIALIGEQPIPNLLPIKYDKPSEILLVRTNKTKPVSLRLKNVLENEVAIFYCDVPPYDISVIYRTLTRKIKGLNWQPEATVFNLTGGTKTMAFAAYQLAFEMRCQFLYLESEGGKSRLRQYAFEDALAALKQDTIIPPVITLDDYLGAHLAAYQSRDIKEPFEQLVFETLKPEVDEIKPAVQDPTGTIDIDLVVRLGNQLGIVEVKTGGSARRIVGINQLNTAGGRDFLGTYTKKFLVVDSSWEQLANLQELAKARYVVVIELPSYKESGRLSNADRWHLVDTVKKTLGVL